MQAYVVGLGSAATCFSSGIWLRFLRLGMQAHRIHRDQGTRGTERGGGVTLMSVASSRRDTVTDSGGTVTDSKPRKTEYSPNWRLGNIISQTPVCGIFAKCTPVSLCE
jgi:hypothetical protein